MINQGIHTAKITLIAQSDLNQQDTTNKTGVKKLRPQFVRTITSEIFI